MAKIRVCRLMKNIISGPPHGEVTVLTNALSPSSAHVIQLDPGSLNQGITIMRGFSSSRLFSRFESMKDEKK